MNVEKKTAVDRRDAWADNPVGAAARLGPERRSPFELAIVARFGDEEVLVMPEFADVLRRSRCTGSPR